MNYNNYFKAANNILSDFNNRPSREQITQLNHITRALSNECSKTREGLKDL